VSRRGLAVLGGALALSLSACETDVPTPREREEIAPLVRNFLVGLARAYSELDAAPLAGLGAPRLLEQAGKDIEMLRAGGVRLRPQLVSLEITDLKVLRRANAYVTCTEVWDTTRLDSYTGELVGRDSASTLHSHIQLKRVEGAWMVLYREVEETATGPRLVVPTAPVAGH
jgi:hypothetical protein